MTFLRDRQNLTLFLLATAILILTILLTITLFKESDAEIPEIPELPELKKPGTEKVIVVPSENTPTTTTHITPEITLFKYAEVTDGCDIHFADDCLLVRSGPGLDFPVVYRLRNGIVLRVTDEVEHDGRLWYKIIFDEWLRYPDRITGDWYVAAEYVETFYDEGTRTTWENEYLTSPLKKIIVDRKKQILTAYDNETIFMEIPISTGLELTPTPQGTFTIYKKTPSRYMQGPLPGLADQQSYDLPGVPWNLYFTEGGAVIHGAYWHNNFGSQYSHGCVNVIPQEARKLYYWAELGTQVIVKN